jgi:hypothetical protein
MLEHKENISISSKIPLLDWKEQFFWQYNNDDADFESIKDVVNAIVSSKEFSDQDIQDFLPDIVQSQKDQWLLDVPWIIRIRMQERMLDKKIDTKEETDTLKEETDPTKEERLNRYNALKSNLTVLQQSYPQQKITQEYIDKNISIFDWTPFQSPEEQKTILSYKYILEQIVAEKTENNPLTSDERILIHNFNTFCFDTGIKSQIELPKIESISSVRDLINNDNLWQHLYQNNTNIKSFIDQKKPIDLTTKDLPLMQHIIQLYPDVIAKDIEQLFLANKTVLPRNFSVTQLVQNNAINLGYIKDNDLSDFLPTIQTIFEKYSQQAEKELQDRSTKTIHQHTLWNCLQTVASYFDTVTLNMEDFATDVKLQANNIQIQNNIVVIQGTIHGKSMTISYDLATGIIQSQDFILANTWVVYVWNNTRQQETLNFHWPTYDEIQKRSTTYTTQSLSNHLNEWNFDDIDQSLRNGLRRKVPVKLDAVLWRQVMEHTIEKNLATKQIQNLLSLWLPAGQAWSENINPELRQIYTIFDKSMDRYTPDELRKLRGLLTQLDTIIRPIAQNTAETQHQIQDPLWVFLFNHEKLQKDSRNKSDHNSFFKFFSALTYNTHDPYRRDVLDLDAMTWGIMAYKMPGENFPRNEKTELLYTWHEENAKRQDHDKWLDNQLW